MDIESADNDAIDNVLNLFVGRVFVHDDDHVCLFPEELPGLQTVIRVESTACQDAAHLCSREDVMELFRHGALCCVAAFRCSAPRR